MSLDPVLRSRINTLLQQHPVVLFMKGSPQAPRCGFSAATAGVLNELLGDYASVDVLADAEIREGIKTYGNWPTIPQLYVNGELIGGADIVQSMYNTGELQKLLGLPEPDRTPPALTITDTAAKAIREALAEAGADTALQLSIDARFQAQFQLAEPDDRLIRADVNGILIQMDAVTASRARGIRIDWVDTPQGSGLAIDNPNAPAPVKPMSVQTLKARLDAGDITLVDVRPPEERTRASLQQDFRTFDDGIDALARLPKDTALAFICHSGGRSARAAEHFRSLGFRAVFNVEGGIDAWSREVDATVPTY
jgi:monothiol glutaredoxin